MRVVVLGLSLSSSWGNGHATTWRALLAALARRGHDILFLEREQPWYAAHRDLIAPDFCTLAFYDSLSDLRRFDAALAGADAVIVGSFVPDGIAVIAHVAAVARGLLGFYDIDTPVTLRALAAGDCCYLAPGQVAAFDVYFSFTGGPTLRLLECRFGARRARALYCAVDPQAYAPTGETPRYLLGYLGTYSPDRQPALERLLLAPARLRPNARFVVAGPQYPDGIDWPDNVERIEHLPPAGHPAFYCSLCWTLNVTRADMVRAGFSPSVRIFEAAACGTPIVSDVWPGIESVLRPGRELLLAGDTAEMLAALDAPAAQRRAIARAARARTLRDHTADVRAGELQSYLHEADSARRMVLAAAD